MKSLILIFSISMTVVAGCGVDGWEPEQEEDDLLDANAANCRKSTITGCLQGQVPAAPDLVVEGKRFFDANDLAARFKTLLPPIENRDGTELTEDQVQVKWISRIDNDSFSDGFHIYLKGASARDQSVMSNGSFAVNRLQPGLYDVRAQKEFKFILVNTSLQARSEIDEELPEDIESGIESEQEKPEVETEEMVYCATLYAEDSFEIRRGYRTGTVVFDHFDVELSECGASTGEIKIQLN